MKKDKITAKSKKPKNIKKKASINIIHDYEEVQSVKTKRKNFFEVQNDDDILMQEMLGMDYTVFIVPEYLTQAKDIKYQILDYLNNSQLIPVIKKTKTFEYDGKVLKILPEYIRHNRSQTLIYIKELYNRMLSKALKMGDAAKECEYCCQDIRTWLDLRISEAENEEIKNYKAVRKKPVKKEKRKENRTLENIWESENLRYEDLITFLQKEYNPIQSSFVLKIDNKLSWTLIPVKGYQKYLAGLIFISIKKGCIAKGISGPDLVSILNNTFNNIVPSLNLYKSIHNNPPPEKYLSPFEKIVK